MQAGVFFYSIYGKGYIPKGKGHHGLVTCWRVRLSLCPGHKCAGYRKQRLGLTDVNKLKLTVAFLTVWSDVIKRPPRDQLYLFQSYLDSNEYYFGKRVPRMFPIMAQLPHRLKTTTRGI